MIGINSDEDGVDLILDLASVGTTPATKRTDIMVQNTITKPESVYAEQS